MWNFSIIVPREFGRIVYGLYAKNKHIDSISFAQTIIEEKESYRYVFAVGEHNKSFFFSDTLVDTYTTSSTVFN